jgi:precorrin-6Y C5,15-methyltransferase (decarboxylating)
MADPWLTVVGLGDDGLDGLGNASCDAIAAADVIFGGPRHLDLVQAGTRGMPWPVPFDTGPVLACRGRRVVVLASGDPFWFGAGSVLAAALEADDWRALPVAGVFSLAAARMGWRVETTRCLGLHAAPFATLRPVLARGVRAVVTLRDGAAVAELAAWLAGNGFGAVHMTVMERLGGRHERVRPAVAQDFALPNIAAPVAVALDCATLVGGMQTVPGLPEAAFAHDGQITKSAVRALTLAALAPRAGAVLWDIGGGSGSVSVEWCLAGGLAHTIERRADRLANIHANIAAFGLSARMQAIEGAAPKALVNLPPPDAVFIGGGGTQALFDALWDQLPIGTRIVANGVTLETEAQLTALHHAHGGTLMRIDLVMAAPLGRMRGWVAARPVVQWSVVR